MIFQTKAKLFELAVKVISSCRTSDQLSSAWRYTEFVIRRLGELSEQVKQNEDRRSYELHKRIDYEITHALDKHFNNCAKQLFNKL